LPYRKLYFAAALAGLLVLGFVATSIISYFTARDSLNDQIAQETLPLTSDNIYSEIERDLLRSILISSLMAHDTFVRDWAIGGEVGAERIVRYLGEIQRKYDTTTSFFVSEQTRNYYHPRGVLKTVSPDEPGDAWYFRVREMNEPYEINVDADTADRSRVTIFVNYRVTDYQGELIGVTGVGLSVDSVARLIETYQARYGRQIYFVDRQGQVVLRGAGFEGAERIRERPGFEQVATKILTSPSISVNFADDQGRAVYVNSRFIPELDWYLLVEQSGSPTQTRILNTLVLNVGVALGITALVLVIAYFTIHGYQLRLEEMATTDKLTGSTNRQVFDMLFDHVTKTARRHRSPVSILTMDVDGFKAVNDAHGHQAGDEVLRMLADTIRAHIRENDAICRWGGDEFVVLLGDCGAESARNLAEKIREAMKRARVHHGDADIAVTVSVGVAEHRASEPLTSLIARADAALYRSKSEGRDRVSDAGPPARPSSRSRRHGGVPA